MVLTWDWWQILNRNSVVIFDTREPVPTATEMAADDTAVYVAIGQVLEDGGPLTEDKYVEIYLELLSGEPYPIIGVGPGDPVFFGWTYNGEFWFDKPIGVGFPAEPFRLRSVLYDQTDLGFNELPGYEQPSVVFTEPMDLTPIILLGGLGLVAVLMLALAGR